MGGGQQAPMPYQPANSPQVDAALTNTINMDNANTAALYGYAQPQYASIYNNVTNNPGNAQAMQSAFDVAGKGTTIGNQEIASGNQTAGLDTGIIQTAWDPQSANYNWGLGQTMGAANVQNAESGVGGSPFGAGVVADAGAQFNRNWQADAQQRQGQGVAQLAANNASADQQWGQGLSTLTTSGLLPQAAYDAQQQQELSALDALVKGLNSITSSSQGNAGVMSNYLNTGISAANVAGQNTKINNASSDALMSGIGSMLGLGASFIPI